MITCMQSFVDLGVSNERVSVKEFGMHFGHSRLALAHLASYRL
jgi:hypothetical protein